MDKIQLLYVENIISRQDQTVQQELTFFMQIENINFDKQVDVIWSGEDGIWHTLMAKYHSMNGSDKEYWRVSSAFLLQQQTLPGNIEFTIRYRVLDAEYWDTNHGQNFLSEADSGIQLAHGRKVQNIVFDKCLNDDLSAIPIVVAIDHTFNAEKVGVKWTLDNWKTSQYSACQTARNYWDKVAQSNARNPNQYGSQIWAGHIEQTDFFKLQYIICCESHEQTIWDNNEANNYSLQREQLKLLILNLHCYQEENQDKKFTQIAKAINALEVDIVCLQEVAEYWRDGQGDWESNAAKLINDRLTHPFHLHTDWSHLGFDKYREGVAILSRFPLSNHQSRYVSDSDDIYNIHSRKVVMACVHVPYMGAINIFSAHLSWMEDGFQEQFQQLHRWAEEHNTDNIKATMLCGDFNITAGSDGYQTVVENNHYDDQYLAANEQAVFEKIFRVNDAHWQDLLTDDYRIDYIFMNKSSALQVTSAKVIFTEQDYGRVSDHCGYFMTFEPKATGNK
ncbi:MAG: endonuclease [Methylococcales symbiont of Hymedesmia sp. n. MRB-2018]|nr:MAG: endonuclease [Methylococcales symbiont of Hymedesmia sp. n. MRB-2018]